MAANPKTKPIDLGCESAENWLLPSAYTVAVVIITQPVIWISFYRPTEGGTLSRRTHYSEGVQPVPKAVYRSSWRDKQPSAVWFEPGSSHRSQTRWPPCVLQVTRLCQLAVKYDVCMEYSLSMGLLVAAADGGAPALGGLAAAAMKRLSGEWRPPSSLVVEPLEQRNCVWSVSVTRSYRPGPSVSAALVDSPPPAVQPQTQARRQEMKWGRGVFFVKKWTFPQRRVHYVSLQYQYFFILHFTYLGGGCVRTRLPTGLRRASEHLLFMFIIWCASVASNKYYIG